MKRLVALSLVVLLTGCASVKSWVPSFSDPNQSARIIDVRQSVAHLDCKQPHAPQVKRIKDNLECIICLENIDNNWLVMSNDVNLVGINNNKANALLISKAPEMLEMLKEIHSFLSSGTRINSDDIYQLIKEATEI
jgi:hypothetical protein